MTLHRKQGMKSRWTTGFEQKEKNGIFEVEFCCYFVFFFDSNNLYFYRWDYSFFLKDFKVHLLPFAVKKKD